MDVNVDVKMDIYRYRYSIICTGSAAVGTASFHGQQLPAYCSNMVLLPLCRAVRCHCIMQ